MTMIAGAAIAGLLLLPVAAAAVGPGGGGGGGKPGGETAGNNLSYPVEWSESLYRLTLPGVMEQATLSGTVAPGTLTMDDLTPCWGAIQKDVANLWQAENSVTAPVNAVTTIDWGDNLESKDWRVGQVVRVETGLYDEVLGTDADGLPITLTKYEMCYISGSGTSEVWGVQLVLDEAGNPALPYTAVTTESATAMVYSAAARLTIQKIDALNPPTEWNASTHLWIDPLTGIDLPATFNKATWEKTADGPGSYGAELNVQGKVVYGYVWTTRGLPAGEYRLTFSIDPALPLPTGTPGVTLAGAQILGSLEAEAVAEEETGGNTPVVDDLNNLTYIDVGLTAGGGGGGRPR